MFLNLCGIQTKFDYKLSCSLVYHAIRKPIVNVKNVFELIVLLGYSFTFLLPLFILLTNKKKNEQNKDSLN